jgi:LmbE family N-acetylglucosaminyl deacetylase
MSESGVFDRECIDDRTVTDYGIEVKGDSERRAKYRANFDVLVGELDEKLSGFTDVITHNPWGEYGHAEHAQVYAAVRRLSQSMHFSVWFTNYCSTRTVKLMSKLLGTRRVEYVSLKTNIGLAKEMMRIYRENGCNTWYEDWQWFDEECLIRYKPQEPEPHAVGQRLPLNFIMMDVSFQSTSRRWRSRIVNSFLKRPVTR